VNTENQPTRPLFKATLVIKECEDGEMEVTATSNAAAVGFTEGSQEDIREAFRRPKTSKMPQAMAMCARLLEHLRRHGVFENQGGAR
jgi:hypothetical protein